MARLAVNPTRMELRRLKTRLKTATRGHKLLKDKSDEMVRRFMEMVRLNKSLREEIEGEVAEALRSFMLARAVSSAEDIEQALSMPKVEVMLEAGTKNIMGVDVPDVKITMPTPEDLLPYTFAGTPSDLDSAVIKISTLTEKLLRLAEVEKTCNMLADEIEKNRRRVNALEYVMIPQLNETIKYILMKLDENERGNLTRLMKVKSMMQEN
ncbi:MAG: V-type ATP synthase subunit D [Clostridia bacterium]|uniref:V-type ATP synthase subunit D n=1 Tax=Pumilibacter muris TaxID=2941510 RepID=UPI00203B30DE|nr:V-type ATP synthase subunit D [Pumilibacter muris]MCI8595574.1 V-type ATP synthase subunit D [Clostridia bacterium]